MSSGLEHVELLSPVQSCRPHRDLEGSQAFKKYFVVLLSLGYYTLLIWW